MTGLRYHSGNSFPAGIGLNSSDWTLVHRSRMSEPRSITVRSLTNYASPWVHLNKVVKIRRAPCPEQLASPSLIANNADVGGL
jgi:hypothetical protein